MRKFRPDVLFICLFVFIVAIFFYPTVLQGKLPVPSDTLVGLYHPWRDALSRNYPRGVPFKNFLITDPVRQQIPWRKIAIDEWKQGTIPLWNPYSFSGASLVGNIQAGVFYPLNILFFFLPFSVAWTVLIILQPLLGGIFLYIFLRHKAVSVVASLVGAVSWSFSGFSIAWLTWGTIGHTALWLPLTLLSIDHLIGSKLGTKVQRQTIFWFLVYVFSMTVQFFAGHAQIALYVLLLSIVYALWSIRIKFPRVVGIPWWFISGVLFFIALSAIQWVPLFRSLLDSSRVAEADLWTKPGWFLPWQHSVQFVIPDFFGNPATMNYFGIWNYGEFIGYIGILSLLFGLYSIRLISSSVIKFWWSVLLVALVFMLPTPIAKIPYLLNIPILSSLQPTRLMVVVDFSLVMLAAYGLDDWINYRRKAIWLIAAGIGGFLAVIWIYVLWSITVHVDSETSSQIFVIRQNLIYPSVMFILSIVGLILISISDRFPKFKQKVPLILIVIIMADLFRFGWKFTPFTPQNYFFSETKTLSFLKSQPKPFRVASIDKELFPSDISAMYGLEDISGYDPVYDSRYEEFFAAMNRGEPDISPPFGFNRILTLERFDTPLLPLLNVKYILSLRALTNNYLVPVYQEGETRVYEDTRSTARVYFVSEVKTVSEKRDIIHSLYSNSFDPRKTAIVEAPLSISEKPLTDKDSFIITRYNESEMEIKVSSSDRRFLVISNIWSPFWKATIDRRETSIVRTDYMLQGVAVPPGTHLIRLEATL